MYGRIYVCVSINKMRL